MVHRSWSPCLYCRELTEILYNVYGTRQASPSVMQWVWVIVCGRNALGELHRCRRCVISLTLWDSKADFPKCSSRSEEVWWCQFLNLHFLIAWVKTQMVSGSSTGRWWLNIHHVRNPTLKWAIDQMNEELCSLFLSLPVQPRPKKNLTAVCARVCMWLCMHLRSCWVVPL